MAIALACCPTFSWGQDQPIVIPLTINEVARGEIPALLRGDDVLVRVSDLEAGGMAGMMWKRVLTAGQLQVGARVEGAEAVSLRSMRPWVEFRLDEESLTLSVMARPELFAPSAFSVAQARPERIDYLRDTTSFMNYSVTSVGGGLTGFAELGTSFRGHLLLSTFSRPAGGSVLRGTTEWVFDERKKLRRWIVGDATAYTDALGGSALVGGVTLSRNFSLDPYFVRYPGMGFRGATASPSRVEIYINGVLTAVREVPPGPFDIRDIPGIAGAGTTRVIVRDAFGREQVTTEPFYYSTSVLAKGLSEYLYSTGFVREGLGSRSFDYGEAVAIANHRKGVREWLTLGGRAEASKEMQSGGPSMTARLKFGEVDASVAGSRDGDRSGAAAQLGYRYISQRLGTGGSLRWMSDQYANLSVRALADRPLLEGTVYAALLLGRGSVGLQWSAARMRDSADRGRLAATTSVSITRGSSFFLSVGSADEGRGAQTEIFAGFSFQPWRDTSANIGYNRRGEESEPIVELQRSLPTGTGYGYRFTASELGDVRRGQASLQYQNRFGRYEASIDPFSSRRQASFQAAGAVVRAGRSLLLTRVVQDSFAVVRIPGVEGVRVYASNDLIGRTDSSGELLIPTLLSYYGNRLRIDDRDIPFEFEIGEVERVIAPPYRGGAIVEFPVRAVRQVSGSVRVMRAAREEIPAFGQITLERGGEWHVSPIGRQGEFYFENATAGSYRGSVEYKEGVCTFDVEIPSSSEMIIELPALICRMGTGS